VSNQRYIRRPVEDAAIGRVDKKKSIVKNDRYREPVTPNYENPKNKQPKAKIKNDNEHEIDNKPVMEKIVNPYNNEICHLCDYSRKNKGEWYCHQDNPVVRCYQILNCSAYNLREEGVIASCSTWD